MTIVLLGLWFAGVIVDAALVIRLRTCHAAIWNELGSPYPFFIGKRGSSIRVLRFLWRNDYVGLGDPLLSILGTILRALQALLVISFVALLVGRF